MASPDEVAASEEKGYFKSSWNMWACYECKTAKFTKLHAWQDHYMQEHASPDDRAKYEENKRREKEKKKQLL